MLEPWVTRALACGYTRPTMGGLPMPVKTGYPRIRLDCPHGHSFWSAAGPGCTVKCPDCLRAGNRVSVRMPSARPRNQRELTAWESQNAEREVSLSDKWDSVSPWNERILLWAPDDHSGVCGKCGKPMSWERARTVVCCPDCRMIDLAPNVGRFYATQAEHKKEITRPQRSKTRQTKIEFGRLKREKARIVENAIAFYSHSSVPHEFRGDALAIADLFKEYLPFVRDAGDETELSEVLSDLFKQWREESGPELRDDIRDARSRVIVPDEDDEEPEPESPRQVITVGSSNGNSPRCSCGMPAIMRIRYHGSPNDDILVCQKCSNEHVNKLRAGFGTIVERYDNPRNFWQTRQLPAGNGHAGANPSDFWNRYDTYVTQQARNAAIVYTKPQTRKCHYCSRIANRIATFQRNGGTLMRYVCDSCQITAIHDGGKISLALHPED